jgi:hypothetical protein
MAGRIPIAPLTGERARTKEAPISRERAPTVIGEAVEERYPYALQLDRLKKKYLRSFTKYADIPDEIKLDDNTIRDIENEIKNIPDLDLSRLNPGVLSGTFVLLKALKDNDINENIFLNDIFGKKYPKSQTYKKNIQLIDYFDEKDDDGDYVSGAIDLETYRDLMEEEDEKKFEKSVQESKIDDTRKHWLEVFKYIYEIMEPISQIISSATLTGSESRPIRKAKITFEEIERNKIGFVNYARHVVLLRNEVKLRKKNQEED